MELLERETQLHTLDARLAGAVAGEGSVVLVTGEAGAGKSALVEAFCRRHGGAAEIRWGRCDAMVTAAPLGPVRDIAAADDRLAELAPFEAPRHRVFSAFFELLAAPAAGGRIVVIEDLHWADEATLDLVVFLSRRATRTRSVVIATLRDDGRPDDPVRAAVGTLAGSTGVHRLPVPPLSRRAVGDLAAPHGVDPDRLYEVTGGNPFYVTEVLGTPDEAVPTTVRDAVSARIATVSSSARAALEAAAVMPGPVEVAQLRDLTAAADEAIEECQAAGLLRGDGSRLRFRHELVRITIEESMSVARRTALHRRVLAYLSTLPGVDAARLAYHANQAGDGTAVLHHAPRAAELAARMGAHRDAAAQYVCALRFGDLIAPDDMAELLLCYATECRLTNRIDEAVEASGRALSIVDTLGDVVRRADALSRHALSLWSAGRGAQARRAAEEAVDLLRPRGQGTSLATALTHLAYLRMLARDIAGALAVGGEAIRVAEREGTRTTLALALNAVGSAQWFVDPGAAPDTLGRSLALARAASDDLAVGSALVNLGSGAGEVRRYVFADRHLREAVAWCAERDMDALRAYGLAWQARTQFEQGRWPQADELLGGALGGGTANVPARIVALTVLGRLRSRRGDPDAQVPLEEAWRLATSTEDLQRLWPVAAGRAEAAWLGGRAGHIPALVGPTYQLAVQLRQEWAIGELAYWLWIVGDLDGAPTGAAEPFARHIAGDWRAAARLWRELSCPYEEALSLASGSEPDELVVAYKTLDGLGAWPAMQQVAQRMREAGVRRVPRTRRPTGSNPARLTGREVEVLRLLGEELSNVDIAARLHISPRTVEHHVAAILGKLGVATRHQAVRAAADVLPDGRAVRDADR
jgi:DNA-binding CsgD family transcriptional regulator